MQGRVPVDGPRSLEVRDSVLVSRFGPRGEQGPVLQAHIAAHRVGARDGLWEYQQMLACNSSE
eukprot:2162286-Prorocentrum_lima.AAC.1